MTKKEIAEKIEACEKELAALRQKMDKPEYGGKRWEPEWGDRYYYLKSDGYIDAKSWDGLAVNPAFYLIGNVFRTYEEAEFEVERLKVIAELSDFAEGDEAVWDGKTRHYYLFYRNYKVLTNFVTNESLGTLYFPSHEAARAAGQAVGADRIKKYYLRVKE